MKNSTKTRISTRLKKGEEQTEIESRESGTHKFYKKALSFTFRPLNS